jgi:hypothetical protein
MNVYLQNQRVVSDEFITVVDYEYFYRLMCAINPELMLELEIDYDVNGKNLEELFLYAYDKLKNLDNKFKIFWVSFALIHITQSDLNEDIAC